MKNWLSMDSTPRTFSKTNSSSCLRKIFNSVSRWLIEAKCRVFYIKQPKCHLNWDSRENGRFRWKTENPCLKNFSGVTGQKLALGEIEESQRFQEVKHSKHKNWFLTMYSLSREISITIFSFQIGWGETKILWFEYFGWQPNWKLKGYNRSNQKYQNGFFSHVFALSHITHRNWQNWIWMSRTHFINFRRSSIC